MLHSLLALFRKRPEPVVEEPMEAKLPRDPMVGTSIYTWHDGKRLYDEVTWQEQPVTRDEAYEIALARLRDDESATRVRIESGDAASLEVLRHLKSKIA